VSNYKLFKKDPTLWSEWASCFVSTRLNILYLYNQTVACAERSFFFSLTRADNAIKFLHLLVNLYSCISFMLLFGGCGRELFFVQHKWFRASSLLATTFWWFSPWTPQAGTTHLYLHFQFLTLNNFFVCFPFSMASGVVLLIHRWFKFALTRSLRYTVSVPESSTVELSD
jgi:hypothetical protein